MSLSEHLPRLKRPPMVLCPRCNTPMKVRTYEPILFSRDRFCDLTYGSEACGADTKQTVKDDSAGWRR
jgi:hypothetical protein